MQKNGQLIAKSQTGKLKSGAKPDSAQGRMEEEARTRLEAELLAAEALAAKLRPEGQMPVARDALLTQKREELSAAMRRNATPREIRQLMAEIKLLEPEAYGTRAAVKSVPKRQQTWARGGPEAYMTGRQLPEGRVERLAFLAQDASANAGLLFGHSKPTGNNPSTALAVAKYLERVSHAVVVDGRLPAGAAKDFMANLRGIMDIKKSASAAEVNTAILGELRAGLAADGSFTRNPCRYDESGSNRFMDCPGKRTWNRIGFANKGCRANGTYNGIRA